MDGVSGERTAEAWDAQGARGRGENGIASAASLTEVRQSSVDDVECTEEIDLPLTADLGLALVLACANYAVAGAVGDHIDLAEPLKCLCDDMLDCRRMADVAGEGKTSG